MKNDPAGEATVSLGRVLIDASPDKVSPIPPVARLCHAQIVTAKHVSITF